MLYDGSGKEIFHYLKWKSDFIINNDLVLQELTGSGIVLDFFMDIVTAQAKLLRWGHTHTTLYY